MPASKIQALQRSPGAAVVAASAEKQQKNRAEEASDESVAGCDAAQGSLLLF